MTIGLVLSLALTLTPEEARPKLAVMRLEAQRVPQEIGRILDELLLKAVDDRGIYDVVSTDEINALLDFEKQKELAGCNDVTCFAEIGGALGVEQLILGSISKLGDQIIVSLKLVNVSGMKIQRSQSRTRDNENLYESAVNDALDRLLGSGTLSIATHPEGARIEVDGTNWGVSPQTLDPLPVGKHQVVLELDNHEKEEISTIVTKGETTALDVSMRLLSGTITIATTPIAATCYLDKKPIGESPCEKTQVAIGQHEVEVRKDHYEAQKTTITVRHHETTPWQVNLIPLPVPMTIGTAPQGAEVSVDGTTMGTTEQTVELTPGTHELELELAGFENFRKSVTVEPGKPESLNFTLVSGLSDVEKRHQTVVQVTKWGLTGLAAAATAIWVWQGLRANSLDRDGEKLHVGSAEFKETRDRGNTAATVADVSMVTALVAAGGATYFWLTVEF
ncbi:PEGA domain-containing protein [Myxococcota bacterium]